MPASTTPPRATSPPSSQRAQQSTQPPQTQPVQITTMQQHPQQQQQQQQLDAQQIPPPGGGGPLQPLPPNVLNPPTLHSPPSPAVAPAAASPPSKRDLKSWWKSFKLQGRNQDPQERRTQGIFGVPLYVSIRYANVAISLIDESGKSYIYGYVPIVVAKCGVFLKEKATDVEGIFRLSGSEKRIKELKLAFDSPDRYGKGLSWTGYTVHDAANVLRRYLNDLPEPVVPLVFYELFREPLSNVIKQGTNDANGPQFVEGFDMDAAIVQYQNLITKLPPLNRQLLLYLLDLLAVFAAKADVNRMNSQNLAAIFQPGILSHPFHAMSPEEYRLNQIVLIFLIENQDHFLIGMNGTAADEQTVQEVQRGTPAATPAIVMEGAGVIGVTRTASNASAGAESVARDGKIRRNRSTSSRNSRHSSTKHVGHAATPRSSSPVLATTPTTSTSSGAAGGLGRSNTLPARSPGLGPGRFPKRSDASSGSPVTPLTPITAQHAGAQAAPSFEPVAEVATYSGDGPLTNSVAAAAAAGPGSAPGVASRDTSLPASGALPPSTSLASGSPLALPTVNEASSITPSKEKRFQLFQRSFTNESSDQLRPQPNKLKKKQRKPSSTNPSAQSSTASLPPASSAFGSPNYEPATNPLEEQAHSPSGPTAAAAAIATGNPASDEGWSHHKEFHVQEVTPHVSQLPSTTTITANSTTPTPGSATAPVAATTSSDPTLRPQKNSPSTSLHSSFNEGSDMDQIDEAATAGVPEQAEQPDKTKKRLWRLSRRRDEMQTTTSAAAVPATGRHPSTSNLSGISSPFTQQSSLGSNVHAAISTSSDGSGGAPLVGIGALPATVASGASGASDPTLASSLEAPHGSQEAGAAVGSDKDGKDEPNKGKLSGWLKGKYREAKENAEQRRNKSPTPHDQSAAASTMFSMVREKSLDLNRATEGGEKLA
ncbi:Rho GTPase activator [Niveomyces insectorum RCEF 264]|uniref:Rho GTPase activator n=1 Tax=Niveomyces insectorum RCEF 264 TaxID=1081102 RepID=A0A167QXZ9_9HYPO|nr:Rho GTPase activator [Niveomyces insectorum RCEF 264]